MTQCQSKSSCLKVELEGCMLRRKAIIGLCSQGDDCSDCGRYGCKGYYKETGKAYKHPDGSCPYFAPIDYAEALRNEIVSDIRNGYWGSDLEGITKELPWLAGRLG
jgi:hypothetical protein